jgi:hypothetical protein
LHLGLAVNGAVTYPDWFDEANVCSSIARGELRGLINYLNTNSDGIGRFGSNSPPFDPLLDDLRDLSAGAERSSRAPRAAAVKTVRQPVKTRP